MSGYRHRVGVVVHTFLLSFVPHVGVLLGLGEILSVVRLLWGMLLRLQVHLLVLLLHLLLEFKLLLLLVQLLLICRHPGCRLALTCALNRDVVRGFIGT